MEEHHVPEGLLGLLRGPEAGTLLRRSLDASGVLLETWRLEQIYARPGAEVSARYRVHCTAAAGVPTGPDRRNEPTELTELTMVASTVALTAQQRATMGAVRADSPHGTVHLWVHPVDPELPGLLVVEEPTRSLGASPGGTAGPGRAASPTSTAPPTSPAPPDSTVLESRLSALLGEPCRLQGLQMLVLRPLRRAVYRAVLASDRGQRVLYLKVVRPARVQQLLRRHGCSPLIPPIADAGDGILVIDQAPGLPVTRHLFHSSAAPDHPQLDPQVLVAALETLTPEALQVPPRVPPTQRIDALARSAVAAGSDPGRVQRLREHIHAGMLERPGPVVPTHGDFHPANLFLDEAGQHPMGLIDADTVGPGFRADDLATMWGHLLTLPSFDAVGYAAVPEFAQRFHSRCLIETDPRDLSARTAAVLLSLMPGALGPQQREHHLQRAEQLVQPLTPADRPR